MVMGEIIKILNVSLYATLNVGHSGSESRL